MNILLQPEKLPPTTAITQVIEHFKASFKIRKFFPESSLFVGKKKIPAGSLEPISILVFLFLMRQIEDGNSQQVMSF